MRMLGIESHFSRFKSLFKLLLRDHASAATFCHTAYGPRQNGDTLNHD